MDNLELLRYRLTSSFRPLLADAVGADMAIVRVMDLRPTVEQLQQLRQDLLGQHKPQADATYELFSRNSSDQSPEWLQDRRELWIKDAILSQDEALERHVSVLDRCIALAEYEDWRHVRERDQQPEA